MYRHGQEDLQKALGDTLRKATGFVFKCADYALENTTNELAELKAKHDKDTAGIDTPKDQPSAKNGPPKCLKQAIRVKDLYGETIGTIKEPDTPLPVTVSRTIMLEDDSSYKVPYAITCPV
ncbi:hypothetical protein AAVH_20979 [Aphelenchoides avenae]|nr:hypothetical protein AAVH_20979 [Aphelenchus avenae]